MLDRLHVALGLRAMIVVDNGPAFVSRVVDTWAYAHGLTLRFIRPGKPVENADIESYNGAFRDECLNEQWFQTVDEARAVIEAWRLGYNQVGPHRSLDGHPPAVFAATRPAGSGSGGSSD